MTTATLSVFLVDCKRCLAAGYSVLQSVSQSVTQSPSQAERNVKTQQTLITASLLHCRRCKVSWGRYINITPITYHLAAGYSGS